MEGMSLALNFADQIGRINSADQIPPLLEDAIRELGFRYFALVHHVRFTGTTSNLVHFTNYPTGWTERILSRRLYLEDPILLASLCRLVGFRWSDIRRILGRLTPRQEKILLSGRAAGLGDGFTIPGNIPGHVNGSVSLAVRRGLSLPKDALLGVVHLIGICAFECVQLFAERTGPQRSPQIRLTQRELDCIAWVIRGKTDSEIGEILGVKEDTVREYLKRARQRYGYARRLQLATRVIFDGQLSLADAFGR